MSRRARDTPRAGCASHVVGLSSLHCPDALLGNSSSLPLQICGTYNVCRNFKQLSSREIADAGAATP
jgi:hypothetical protein